MVVSKYDYLWTYTDRLELVTFTHYLNRVFNYC